ncbi:MAG: hypothetical protein V9G98_17855 [Candidatus Competibacter sp.]
MVIGAFLVGVFLGQSLVGGQADFGGAVADPFDQQFPGPGARLAGLASQFVHGPAAHVGMHRGDRPAQGGFRALAVPGPQRSHGFPAHVFGFVVQSVAEQPVDASGEFVLGSRAVLDQQLQGAGPNLARLRA